jgi:CrcB protein
VLLILAIALGGAAGALGRYFVSRWVYGLLGTGFPYGTLTVNVLGSFIMGLLTILLLERLATDPELRGAILVGFLGAFTTFSTFSMETVSLIEDGLVARALTNMVLSVLACVLAAWFGLTLGRQL